MTATDDRIDATELSGTIGLNYKPSESWLVYGSVGKGFKSGGFFGGITFSNAELAPFDPEELIAYESGFKARLAGDTLQLSGAVFYYDYQDIQTFVQVSTGGISVLKLDNVDEAKVYGRRLRSGVAADPRSGAARRSRVCPHGARRLRL